METMYTYICKEEKILENIVKNRKENFNYFTNQYLSKTWNIFSTGSSYNAAIVVEDFLKEVCGIDVLYHNNYDYLYYSKDENIDGIAIGISQSGSSTSTIRALDKVDIPKVGLTSNENSKIVEAVDYVQNIHIGVEKVGYVTLGYSAIMLNLMIMGLETALNLKTMQPKEYEEWINLINEEILSINKKVSYFEKEIEKTYSMIDNTNQFVAIGSGNTYMSLMELDTKFIETIRKPVNIRELDEFMHGQYLQLNENQFVVFFETGILELDQEMRRLKEYVSHHTSNIVTVGYDVVKDENYWRLETTDIRISMLSRVIPIQLMAYKYAEYIGSDYMSEKFKNFGEFMKSKDKREV